MYRVWLKTAVILAACGLAGSALGASSGHLATPDNSSVDITGVSQPVQAALGVFAGVLLAVILARSPAVRSRVKRWRAAVVEWINAV